MVFSPFYAPYSQGYRNRLGAVPYAGVVGSASMYGRSTRPALRSRVAPFNSLVTSRRKTKGRYKHSFKSKLFDSLPAKHSSSIPVQAGTHNTIYSFSPTQFITQGDANNNRDGDSVYLCALKLKGVYTSGVAENAYSFRIIVGWSGEEYTLPSGNFGAGLTSAEIFLPLTTGTWQINGIINPKAFTAVYDETFDVNSIVAETREIRSFSISVPFNSSFSYQSSASIFGKTRNLYVILIMNVGAGTDGSTPSGGVSMGSDMIFK